MKWTDELRRASEAEALLPIPVRIYSNGEYAPPPQTGEQARVQQEIDRLAGEWAPRLGLDRRGFLRSAFGFAAGFTALNTVFGPNYAHGQTEIGDAEAIAEMADRHADQFIFDGHMHFVHDDYAWEGITNLRRSARQMDSESVPDREPTLEDLKFENFLKEVFFDSDTTAGIVSTATSDNPDLVFLSNPQIASDVERFNAATQSRRLYGHAAFHPGAPGWLDQVEAAIESQNPASWKGYTIGDPLTPNSQHPWRMDDEDLVYPVYEGFVEAGITTVCIHKGMVPGNYRQALPDLWPYANVEDVGKAAQDWPQLNFVIYHAAFVFGSVFDPALIARFEETGRMEWINELAEIPERYDVTNVWADVGTAFGQAAATQPRMAAAMMAILARGLGQDRVLWGTDSVCWGSPQWQIEAFRRIETPEDLQERFGLPALGPGDGELKTRIFGLNSADLYGLSPAERTVAHYAGDALSQAKSRYLAEGGERSNAAYGFIEDI
jgi:predicted TIM-barrel fold metal-dependent hydrolase